MGPMIAAAAQRVDDVAGHGAAARGRQNRCMGDDQAPEGTRAPQCHARR